MTSLTHLEPGEGLAGVRARHQGEAAHVQGDVPQGAPHGQQALGASPHVHIIHVHAGEGPLIGAKPE